MEKILVAFDGSKHAVNAAKEAKKLSLGFPNAKITVLRIIDLSEVDASWFGLSNAHGKEMQFKIDEVKDKLDCILGDYHVEVIIGDPATEIINFVNSSDFDYLVMGIRGLNILQRVVMGSVSQQVVKYVNVPVIIVK